MKSDNGHTWARMGVGVCRGLAYEGQNGIRVGVHNGQNGGWDWGTGVRLEVIIRGHKDQNRG